MAKRKQDHFARRARREGKAARSIYKLEEIDQRYGLLNPGSRVLDLGCSPGSWMQYAAQKVGSSGRVLGYDLKPVEVSLPSQAEARVGNIYELDVEELGGAFHVVLSDMAPATMGDHKTDALRSAALAEAALGLAETHLGTGGSVVVKVLEGGEVPQLVQWMRQHYKNVQRLRPKATRRESTEIFLIGINKLPPSPEADSA